MTKSKMLLACPGADGNTLKMRRILEAPGFDEAAIRLQGRPAIQSDTAPRRGQDGLNFRLKAIRSAPIRRSILIALRFLRV
jgi:hypothetical protein